MSFKAYVLHLVCFQLFPTFSHLLPSAIFKHGNDVPGRAKDIERFGEAVIVDEAGVHGEYAHEQDQVAPAEKGVPDLQGEKAVPVTKVPAIPSNSGPQEPCVQANRTHDCTNLCIYNYS